MNDPKYEIRDGRLWHIAGNYPVPSDEPVVTLRGKDPVTLAALAAYYLSATDDSHRISILERIVAVGLFQMNHLERTKVGCHLCGDEPLERKGGIENA